jgi:lipase
VDLHTHSWGPEGAPLVVCLHGVQAHGGRFRRIAETRLVPAGFRVLALDFRGHGRSGWEPPWLIEQHVADAVETAPEPAVWMGHSFGGRLVLEVAARHPRLVERAVLLDPALTVRAAMAFEAADAERAEHSYATPEDALEELVAGTPRAPRDLLEEEVADHLERSPDGRFRWRYSRAAVVAMFAELARPAPPPAACPTLVVVGEETEYVLPEHLEPLDAEVAYVPGGHRVLLEAVEETGDAVVSFLERTG